MRAVESDYVAQSGEILFQDYATQEDLTSAFSGYAAIVASKQTLFAISKLEQSITLRMMREAFLGSTTTISDSSSPYNGMTAAQAIASVQTQIATLRTSL